MDMDMDVDVVEPSPSAGSRKDFIRESMSISLVQLWNFQPLIPYFLEEDTLACPFYRNGGWLWFLWFMKEMRHVVGNSAISWRRIRWPIRIKLLSDPIIIWNQQWGKIPAQNQFNWRNGHDQYFNSQRMRTCRPIAGCTMYLKCTLCWQASLAKHRSSVVTTLMKHEDEARGRKDLEATPPPR